MKVSRARCVLHYVARDLTAHIWVGMYKGGEFTFSFAINTNYPHDPPKVKCIPKVSFPSITRPVCDFNTDRLHPMLDLPP